MNKIWYDKTELLSYNSILNFIIGLRGGGKTFGYKEWCITDFLKNDNQFVWVRRYKSELINPNDSSQGVIKSFFDDIKFKFPNVKLEIKGMNAYINDKLAGYFISLSLAHNYKSTAFPSVNKIIFDEFLIANKGMYLKNEATILLDLIETVQRSRDNVRCICIGNAVSFANPYFMYFGIRPFNTRFLNIKEKSITVEMYTNSDFIKMKKQTRFGKLINDTKYSDYAIDNKFFFDNDKFIEKRPSDAKFLIALKYDGVIIGIWESIEQGKLYASLDYDKNTLKIYALSTDDHDINYMLINQLSNNYFIKYIKKAFEYSLLYFEDIIVKTKTLEALSFL